MGQGPRRRFREVEGASGQAPNYAETGEVRACAAACIGQGSEHQDKGRAVAGSSLWLQQGSRGS